MTFRTARRIGSSRSLMLLPVLTLLAAGAARAAQPDRAYTFRELLDRAHLIAVGEVVAPGSSKEGAPLRKHVETGLLRVRKVLRGKAPERPVRFRVDGPPLPAGAKAIWFLTAPGPDGVFVIDHPQCAYDLAHRTLVEIGIKAPERIRPGYYLRREDEKLAESIRRAEQRRELALVRPGPSAEGLALAFETVEPKSRAGEPILARFTLSNAGTKPLLVCDSAQEAYFVVAERDALPSRGRAGVGGDRQPSSPLPLTPSLKGRGEVAKAGAPAIPGQSELGIGLLITEHDFTRLAPGASITRSLTISPKYLAALREAGKVRIRGVYHYRRPKAPLVDLPANAWEGSVASEPVELEVLPPLGR